MLLSPKASSPLLMFHHYAVLRTLLRQGERRSALKYLYYKMPAIESIQDARLCVDVLLQNKYIKTTLADCIVLVQIAKTTFYNHSLLSQLNRQKCYI